MLGRIAASPMTYANAKTEGGKFSVSLGEGKITADPIAKEFFGCVGVAHIPHLQDKLLKIGRAGYRHHVSLTFGSYESALKEAFTHLSGIRFHAVGGLVVC